MGTSQTDLDLPLVQALQAGDESALNKLIRKYQEPLFWFIWRYTGDEETARDLLQETFVRLYFGIRRFKPHAKFATWLYSIAMNLCRVTPGANSAGSPTSPNRSTLVICITRWQIAAPLSM
jgi:RNA polymerase sigma factor, sigma-70 family